MARVRQNGESSLINSVVSNHLGVVIGREQRAPLEQRHLEKINQSGELEKYKAKTLCSGGATAEG